MLVSDFNYHLPEELIAQSPLTDRAASRLLRIERSTGRFDDLRFRDFPDLLRPDDLLVLTADHGCDVTAPHTDHTREYAPLLAAFPDHGSRRHDGALADVGASVLSWLAGEQAPELPGRPFC